MKGFVLAEANFAVGHLHGQTLVFLASELGQERFHLGGNGLLGPIGRWQELFQAGQSQEPPDAAETTVIGLHEDQMERCLQPMQRIFRY
jgi:hypothetical protein